MTDRKKENPSFNNAGNIQKKENNPLAGGENRHLSDLFESSPWFVYFYKKVEKLAMATYMVTDTIPESENLRIRLRKSVLDLLDCVISLKDKTKVEKENAIADFYDYVLSIVSLIDIAYATGLISEMNSAVLKREFYKVIDYIKENKDSSPVSSISLEGSFFSVPEPKKEDREAISEARDTASSTPDENSSYRKEEEKSSPIDSEKTLKNSPKIGKRGRVSDYEASIKRSQRLSVIFKHLEDKKFVTARDIANSIKSCSEKTIQRELVSLVKEGALRKEGEKRWSKYYLNPRKPQ